MLRFDRRYADQVAALEKEIPDSIAVPCDVSDATALEQVIAEVGNPKVVVHNAVGDVHADRGGKAASRTASSSRDLGRYSLSRRVRQMHRRNWTTMFPETFQR